ncbi:hypothetical protein PENTCL1PPCAC_9680, partial [Pristionchus entomophagus]
AAFSCSSSSARPHVQFSVLLDCFLNEAAETQLARQHRSREACDSCSQLEGLRSRREGGKAREILIAREFFQISYIVSTTVLQLTSSHTVIIIVTNRYTSSIRSISGGEIRHLVSKQFRGGATVGHNQSQMNRDGRGLGGVQRLKIKDQRSSTMASLSVSPGLKGGWPAYGQAAHRNASPSAQFPQLLLALGAAAFS